jgi:hypothetical protein
MPRITRYERNCRLTLERVFLIRYFGFQVSRQSL